MLTRMLLGLLLFHLSCLSKTSSTQRPDSKGASTGTLDPNACASLYEPSFNALPVDPSTLTLTAGTITAVPADGAKSYYLPYITVEANPAADSTYYQLCDSASPANCKDGIILTPLTTEPGWYGAYIYTLPGTPGTYTVSLSACVRADRVASQGSGTHVVSPQDYTGLQLYCGPALSLSTPYIQSASSDSSLATYTPAFQALHTADINVTLRLYDIMNAAQTYVAQYPNDTTQLAGMIATLVQARESAFPLLRSTAMEQASATFLASATSAASASATDPSNGASGTCVTNGQAAAAAAAPPPTADAAISSTPVTSTPVTNSVVSDTTSATATPIDTIVTQSPDITIAAKFVQIAINNTLGSSTSPAPETPPASDASNMDVSPLDASQTAVTSSPPSTNGGNSSGSSGGSDTSLILGLSLGLGLPVVALLTVGAVVGIQNSQWAARKTLTNELYGPKKFGKKPNPLTREGSLKSYQNAAFSTQGSDTVSRKSTTQRASETFEQHARKTINVHAGQAKYLTRAEVEAEYTRQSKAIYQPIDVHAQAQHLPAPEFPRGELGQVREPKESRLRTPELNYATLQHATTKGTVKLPTPTGGVHYRTSTIRLLAASPLDAFITGTLPPLTEAFTTARKAYFTALSDLQKALAP